MIPETRYADSAGYSIAYQVIGEGPDLVLIPGFVSNLEMMWDIPPAARFLARLSSFSRLITFDKRGTGLSDRVPWIVCPRWKSASTTCEPSSTRWSPKAEDGWKVIFSQFKLES